ncbi:hypothetical protein ACQZ4Q_08060 [Agrobacterium vitis]
MTVEISTLRVVSEMDTSSYEAGARQKVAADEAMVASAQKLGQTFSQNDQKISNSANATERLKRTYVDGYASAQRFNQAIDNLSRSVERGNISLQDSAGVLDGIYRKHGMVADASKLAAKGQLDLARAVEQANGRFKDQQNLPPANQNHGRSSFSAQNIAYQAQDVITQAAMGGTSSAMIALQQGPQAAMSFQGMSARQAISAIGGAAASIVSPLSLATIAVTGLLAAGVGYFSRMSFGAKSVDDALKEHQLAIQKIKDTYDAASKSKAQFGQRTQTELRYTANTDQTQLQKVLDQSLRASSLKLTPALDASQYDYAGADIAGTQAQQLKDKYGAYAEAVSGFAESARTGTGDVAAFREEVQRIANGDTTNKFLQDNAKFLLDVTNNASEAAKAIEELAQKQRDYEISFSRTQAAANAQKYNSENGEKLRDMQRQHNATLSGLGARSPEQLERAARARAEARPVDATESPQVRQTRIDIEGDLARRQAQQQLTQAQNDRVRALNASVDAQRNELSLIGKTGGELAALQMEYQQLASLRENAAKTGVKADEDEIALIKQKAAEAGRYVDLINKAKFQDDIAFQQRQFSRNPEDQQIASQLKGAGLPENLQSNEANQLRSLAQQQSARSQLNSFYQDFASQMQSNGGKIGKAFGDTFRNALLASAAKMGEQAMDKLFGYLIGSLQSKGGSEAGGVVGLASKGLGLTGGKSAANDNGGSGIVGIAKDVASINSGKTPTGSMAQYAQAIKNIESGGGNYSALGPVTGSGDRAYGAYQVMGSNVAPWTKQALGKSLTPDEFLKDPSAQDAVFNQQFGKSVSKYGNPQDAASVWFTGRPQSQGGGAKDILGTSGSQYVEKFNASVSKMGTTVDATTKNIDGFGSGLSQAGSALVGKVGGLGGAAGSVSSAAGGFDWSSLTSSSFKTNTTYGDFIGATGGQQSSGGGLFGLLGGLVKGFGSLFHFADGTESAPGGLAIVGERGRELVNLPRGSQVIPNHRTESALAANGNSKSGFSARQSRPQVNVTIMGNTYSDNHLQNSISNAVQQGYQAQEINNRRGNTGAQYERWNKDKG